jgi:hypothetical protein
MIYSCGDRRDTCLTAHKPSSTVSLVLITLCWHREVIVDGRAEEEQQKPCDQDQPLNITFGRML